MNSRTQQSTAQWPVLYEQPGSNIASMNNICYAKYACLVEVQSPWYQDHCSLEPSLIMHQFHNEISLVARIHSEPFLDMRVTTVGSFLLPSVRKK